MKETDTYILVQCSSGHLNKDLISCARHKAVDELENFRQRDEWEVEYARSNRRIHVIFIVSLPKLPGGTKFAAFQGGKWLCVHLDYLRSPEANALTFMAAVQHPISELFYPGCSGIALHQRLRNCIQAAVSQIPEALDKPSRKVQLLNTLLGAIPEHMEVVEGKSVPIGNTFSTYIAYIMIYKLMLHINILSITISIDIIICTSCYRGLSIEHDNANARRGTDNGCQQHPSIAHPY